MGFAVAALLLPDCPECPSIPPPTRRESVIAGRRFTGKGGTVSTGDSGWL